jgi:hypothetical protein
VIEWQSRHEFKLQGIFGIDKVIRGLAQHYYLTGIRKDAARHVQSCHLCQTAKALQQAPTDQILAIEIQETEQMVSIQLVGPQQVSHRRHV